MAGMMSETEALERVLATVVPGPEESVPLNEAGGRVCRESITARWPGLAASWARAG